MSQHQKIRHLTKHPWVTFFVRLALMAGLWILLVSGTKPQEMILGAVVVTLCAIVLQGIAHTTPLALEFRPRDILTFWRIPWYIVSDTFTIVAVLVRSLFGKPAGDYYRVTGFNTSRRDPERSSRRVLATLYTTCTPNSIVIGIDNDQSRLLFHQLQRSRTPKTLKELGART